MINRNLFSISFLMNCNSSLNDSSYRHSSLSIDSQTQNILSTVTGVFDSRGGILQCKETGVSIVIPCGALSAGERQEIYFKVCQDSSLLPLDKKKGFKIFIQFYIKKIFFFFFRNKYDDK